MEQPPPAPRSVVADIPESVDRLIARCLEPDPAKRYQTTEDLARELDRLDDAGEAIPEPQRFTPRVASVIYRPAPSETSKTAPLVHSWRWLIRQR